MIEAVGWEKKDGESANWVPHRPDLRPFDLVYREDSDSKWQGLDFGFSDPTRMGLLRARYNFTRNNTINNTQKQ